MEHEHKPTRSDGLRLLAGWTLLIAGVVLGSIGAAEASNTHLLWGVALIFGGGVLAGSPVIWHYFS